MNDIKELINIADCLCEGYRDMPCGCEGCPLWNLEEYEKDEENYLCDLAKILNRLEIEE